MTTYLFVFFMEQINLVIRYDPVRAASAVEFRGASAIHILTFVSLIGSSLPFVWFIIPTLAIYATVNWFVFLQVDHCDILISALKFSGYALLSVCIPYLTQSLALTVF
jgi:hypothetical protein